MDVSAGCERNRGQLWIGDSLPGTDARREGPRDSRSNPVDLLKDPSVNARVGLTVVYIYV